MKRGISYIAMFCVIALTLMSAIFVNNGLAEAAQRSASPAVAVC